MTDDKEGRVMGISMLIAMRGIAADHIHLLEVIREVGNDPDNHPAVKLAFASIDQRSKERIAAVKGFLEIIEKLIAGALEEKEGQ